MFICTLLAPKLIKRPNLINFTNPPKRRTNQQKESHSQRESPVDSLSPKIF